MCHERWALHAVIKREFSNIYIYSFFLIMFFLVSHYA